MISQKITLEDRDYNLGHIRLRLEDDIKLCYWYKTIVCKIDDKYKMFAINDTLKDTYAIAFAKRCKEELINNRYLETSWHIF